MNLLKVQNLSFKYDWQWILENVNFSLTPGKTLGIIGPNGGGKSTLLKLIAGLLKPTRGEIELPRDVTLAWVPQKVELKSTIPMTVRDFLSLFSSQNNQLINSLGLSKKTNLLLENLSGGELQRIFLARALSTQAKIILMDEPTTGLDSSGLDQLHNLIENYKEKYKTSFIIVDHNINHMIKNCDHILCLNKGHHWHDHKDLLTKNILESIYHCEFEHLAIHERRGLDHDHKACDVHLNQKNTNESHK